MDDNTKADIINELNFLFWECEMTPVLDGDKKFLKWRPWTQETQFTAQNAIMEAAAKFPSRSEFEDLIGEEAPWLDAFDPGQDHTVKYRDATSLWTRPPFDYGSEVVRNPDGSVTLKAVSKLPELNDC